jgi:hypothetical protein
MFLAKATADFHGQPRWSHHTRVQWQPCSLPAGEPTFISPSGSRYWESDDGVIRASDHWGTVASCEWNLPAAAPVNGPGFAAWEDFQDLDFLDSELHRQCVAERRARRAVSLAGFGAGDGFTAIAVGLMVRATRRCSERSGGHFRFWTETVTFVIAKITPAFLVTADGHRFSKATLSDLHLLEA